MTDIVTKKINKERLGIILNKIFEIPKEKFIDREIISGILAAILQEYLEEKGIKTAQEQSLFENPVIAEELEIADIKLENGVVVDIRAVVGTDYPQMCIPKEHFKLGIQPDIYLGMKVDRFLEEAEIIGFVKTEDISLSKGNNEYFVIDFDEFNSINDLENVIFSIEKKDKKFLASDHEKATNLFIPFLDKTISDNDKNYLLEHIYHCPECKKQLNTIISLDYLLKAEKDRLLPDNDYSLRLLLGDPVLASENEVEVLVEKQEEQEEAPQESLAEESIIGEEEIPEDFPVTIEQIFNEEQPIEEDLTNPEQEDDLTDLLSLGELATEELSIPTEIMSGAETEPPDSFEPIEIENLISQEEHFEEIKQELPVLEENPLILSETEEEKESQEKKVTPRDWAEALAANASIEKEEKLSLFSEEKLGVQDLRKEETEQHSLHEDSLEEINLSETSKETALTQEQETKNTKEIIVEEDCAFDTLEDVEILQGEDDINNILAFFDAGMETKQENIPKPEINQSKPPEQPGKHPETEKKDRGDIKVKKGDSLGYTSVIEAGDAPDDDSFFAEEDTPIIEVIKQDELIDIFGADIAQYKAVKNASKKEAKLLLKDAINDKSVIAFAVAITLSTTVLFLYLGQINKQIKISNDISVATHSPEQPVNITPPPPVQEEPKRRTPTRTYSREIVKVIKPDQKKSTEKISNNFMDNFTDSFVTNKKAPTLAPTIRVKNISWELPAEIALDTQMKDYFIQIGQQIKDNLSENLDLSGLDADNAAVKLYAELNNKGEIETIKIATSSGNIKIDKICINTLKEVIGRYKISSSTSHEKIKFLLLIRT